MGTELRAAPRQERSERTVAQLVEATQRVLDRDGADGATTTAIAAEAGVSVGRLYYWFADLDALLAAAAERSSSAFEARLERVRRAADTQSFGHALEQLVGVVADLVWSHPGAADLLVGRRGALTPPGSGAMRRALESCVNDLVRAFVPAAPADERDVVAALSSEIVVAGTASMLTGAPALAERLEHELVYALVAYLSSRYPAAGDAGWSDPSRAVRPARAAARGAWRHSAFAPSAR